jgi:hypothetical protein
MSENDNQKRPDFGQVKSFTVMRYTINFRDGLKKDCLTSDGALRVIAFRHRVTPDDLITDTTEERILVWLCSGENTIAEVIASTLP